MKLVELVPPERRHHLTEVVLGRAPGREDEKELNMFESEGTGVQFAAVAHKVYTLAKVKGAGQQLPLDWFLQDIRD